MSDLPSSPAPGNVKAQLQARWATLAPREQNGIRLAAAVLGLFLLWSLAIAPAWRTVRTAPALREAQDLKWQQMQSLSREATALRAVPPVPVDAAQAALTAATERLGEVAKLSLQGERAVLTLKGISGAQLSAWMAEARAGARARVIEASLNQTAPGLYTGSLSVALGARS
jgi:general secretion pathway protein M